MRECDEIERDAIAEAKRLSTKGYSIEELKMFINAMNYACDILEETARERVSIAETLPDAAKKWPSLNQPDEPTAAEATVDIEKIAESINRQIQKSLTKQNAKNPH